MLLSRRTDNSLRLLIYLALHEDRTVTIKEIARQFGISRNHLMKIAQRLAHLGYIHTARGRGGGMRLARPPRSINLRSVVWDMEPTFEIMDCHNPLCPIAGHCILKKALIEGRACFLEALSRYTVGDLLDNKVQLLKLLGGNVS